MYTLGVMYVPVIVGGVPHTVEWYHAHEVDPDLLQLDVSDTVDEWPIKETEDFERQLWPLGMWFDYVEDIVEGLGEHERVVIRPTSPTAHSTGVPDSPCGFLDEMTGAAVEDTEFPAIESNDTFDPSDEQDEEKGVGESFGDDGLQDSTGSTSRPPWPLNPDGSERPLAKDTDGYASPVDVYRRLTQNPKVKTAVLDTLVAPLADAHIVVVVKGEERIQCGLSREVKAGRWVPLPEGRCGATTTTLESYRRHLIQCHLDAGRMEGKTQGEVLDPLSIEIRLNELIAQAVGAGLSVDAITPMEKTRKRRRDDDQDSHEETESEEDDSDDVDFLPKRGRSARKRPRIAVPRAKKSSSTR
ncbi:hypothetical protein FRC17_002295 [Serendipita sp. 399]|nr:hypothetical protein FRC17_002295 [Serendipita sp. 399]